MKKLLQFTLFSLLLVCQLSFAQVSGYGFSQSSGPYTPITGGSIAAASTVATTLDSEVVSALPIGFTFNYNGADYTTFGINVNGWISMGSTLPVSTSVPLSGTTNNVISAASTDLLGRQFVTASTTLGNTITVTTGSLLGVSVGDAIFGTGIASGATVVSIAGSIITTSASGVTSTGTGRNIRFANGNIRYQTIGSTPNRQLVVQWTKFSRYTTTGPSDFFNFQIILNETTNIINTAYNFPYINTANSMQVGLRGATSADYNTRATTTTWNATTAGASNTATCAVSGTIFPASGQTFTWTPPSCIAPGNLSTTNLTSTSASINWSAVATAVGGYEWELRSSGVCGSGSPLQSGISTGISVNLAGLTANTTYTYCIRSICAGPSSSGWSSNTFYTGHCLASSTAQTSWISALSTTGGTTNITHTAAAGAVGGYLDLTATNIVSNFIGQTTSFSITSGGATVGNAIWIDWNNNLVFETAERVYVSTAYGTTVTGSFLVPAATPNGNYRMRVITDFNNPAPSNPCGLIARGEYKDFTFSVVSPTPCADPTAIVISGVTNTKATATWTAGSPAPALGYKWEVRSTGAAGSGAAGLVASGTTVTAIVTATATGLLSNTGYTFYVQAACAANFSNWIAQTFTTTNLNYVVYSNSTPKSINDTIEVFFEDYDTTNNFFTGTETTIWGYACLNTNAGHFQYCNMDANNTATLIPFARQSPGIYKATFKVIDYFCVPTGDTVYTVDMFFRNQYGLGGNNQTGNLELEVDDAGVVINPPTALLSSAITGTTATISWTAPVQGANKGYEYAVTTTNVAPASGISVILPNADVSGLIGSTIYYYFVRTKGCGTNVSAWSASSTFTTACLPATLTTTDGARCGTGTVGLTGTPSSGTTAWYAAATGGSPLFTGNSFTTPSISTTTNYYAESQISGSTVTLGAITPTTQGGTIGTQTTAWNVNFTVSQSTTLTSVDVFPITSGQAAAIALRDSAGTIISTINYTTNVSGGATAQTVNLGFSLVSGSYQLFPTLPTAGVSRNISGAVYPYTSSVANITGNGFDATYYMSFYNWKFASICASSPRNTVIATVTPAPSITTSSNVTICSGNSTTLTVSSANAGYAYVWSPATGLSATTGASVTANPTTTTTYTVTANDVVSGCSNTSTVTVTVNSTPVGATAVATPASLCEGGAINLTSGFVAPVNMSTYTASRTSGTSYTSIFPATNITTWRAATATNTDDNMSNNQPIGFNFKYNGATYSTFRVSTNGFLTFDSASTATGGGSGAYGYANDFTLASSGLIVAPNWDDLQTGGNLGTAADLNNSINYTTTGASGSRILTVEWKNMQDFSTTSTASYNWQIKLYESDGRIEFVYGTMTQSASSVNYSLGLSAATVSASPTAAQLLSQTTTNTSTFGFTNQTALNPVPASNSTITFVAPIPYTYSWTGPNSFTSSSASPVISAATASASGVYNLVVTNPVTGCPSSQASTAAVIVNPTSVGGTVSSAQTICSGATPVALTLSGNVGIVTKWQSATNVGFTAGILDIANTTSTLTLGALTTTTYYRAVVQSGVCTTSNSNIVTITVTPNTFSDTTATACDTYTWASNNTAYTTSGTYLGTPVNCVTPRLILTITPGSFSDTNATSCDSYTWSSNNTLYTSSGTYLGTPENCVTPRLILTITPSSFSDTNATACDTYTWSSNNTVYTTSGTYLGTPVNCVTPRLILTITPSSFSDTIATTCDSYTWTSNNTLYTASGTYLGTPVNCVTPRLILTITPSSTASTSVTVCDTYTWANNNTTYTTSGTYNGTTTNCVTQQLVLTITPSSTATTSVTACDTYTWANNNTTYTTSGTYTGTTINCVTEQLTLTITPLLVPTFASVAPLCLGDTSYSLPLISSNGVVGTWAPAFDNLNSGIYIFTPTAGQCATTATLSITIGGTTTWTGVTWDNGIPTSASTAIIAASYSEVANITACTLTITSNAVVTIPAGNTVTLNGILTVVSGSTFTLENGANLIQASAVANATPINVKRTTPALMRQDYVLWSSPVANQNLLAFSPQTVITRFNTYNPANNQYVSVASPSTTNFSVGTGYLIRLRNNHPTTPTSWTGTFTGVPNNGPVGVTVTSNTFNAVGNPYPSAISADAFMAANNSAALYFWRKTNNTNNASYAIYTAAGGVANSGGDTLNLIPNGNIQVGQGFLVRSAVGASSLNFTNAMRVSSVGPFLRSAAKSRIWLDMTSTDGIFSQTMVAYMPNATSGIDNGIDGLLISDATNSTLSSLVENQEYAIQGRALPFENTDVVPLSFKCALAGNHTVAINHVDGLFDTTGQAVYIQDNLTNTVHNLGTPYNFVTGAGVFNSRFQIVYQPAGTLATTNPTLNDNNVIVYKQDENVVINTGAIEMANVKIFDIRGRLLIEKSNINTSNIKLNIGSTNQVLIVKIISKTNEVVTKKIIN